MRPTQIRLESLIARLEDSGWVYKGLTHTGNRRIYAKGTIRATVGAMTFFVWDLADESHTQKLNMKLGDGVCFAVAEEFYQPYAAQAEDLNQLLRCLRKIRNGGGVGSIHARAALVRHESLTNTDQPVRQTSKYLDRILSQPVRYDIGQSDAQLIFSDWVACDVADKTPDDQQPVVDWLVLNAIRRNSDRKEDSRPRVVRVWRYCQWLQMATEADVTQQLSQVEHQNTLKELAA